MMYPQLLANGESLREVGMSPIMVLVGFTFLAVLALGSGVGMWLGTKWGWWLSTFYYMYSVFRNACALWMVISIGDQLQGEPRGIEYHMIKHGGRVVVHSLLFLYFFKGNVLEYFDVTSLRKWKAVGILIGICIALIVANSVAAMILT